MSASAIESESERWFEDTERLLHETRMAESRRAPGGPPSIAGYDDFSEISRGGQGVIYRAVQSSTSRVVAIKVLSDEDGSSIANRHRFAREIEMSARLDHPGIVRVLDSGIAADGRAFLVMEHLEGCSLAHLLNMPRDEETPPGGVEVASHRAMWPVDRALEMMAAVCDAVHFAHQRGMIHRDLKPSNIQIHQGRPCVLDFGLARSLDGRARSSLTATASGSFLGSLPWASPEQVQGRIDELSIATDIYSIGVITYQVLTGRFPYCVEGPLHWIIENIRNEHPLSPSRHRAELDPDVDAIVLRCLEKEPKNRYASVAALADDIRRHLAGEPIEARRTHLWRNMQSGLRSARRGLIVTSLLALALAGVACGALHLQRQTARAEQAATEQILQAQRERDRADAVLRFLSHSLNSLNPANPERPSGSMRDVMRFIGDRAMTELAGEPAAQMRALRMIGQTQFNLGDVERAEASLRRADELWLTLHGESSDAHASETAGGRASILRNLGLILHGLGRLDEAEDCLRRAHALLSSNCAVAGDDSLLIANMIDLGAVLSARGAFDESRAVLEDAAARARGSLHGGGAHPRHELPLALHRLGQLAVNDHRLDDAQSQLDEAERLAEQLFGAGSVQLADCLLSQASLFKLQRRYQDAQGAAQRAATIYADGLGESHWRTALAWIAHAEVLFVCDPHDLRAEHLLAAAVATMRAQFSSDHPTYAFALERMGTLFKARGECDRAVEHYEPAREIFKASPHADPVALATVEGRLACCAGLHDGDQRALPALLHALEELKRGVHPSDGRLAELQRCVEELTAR